MYLLASLTFACVASLPATHGYAEVSPETNIYERASSGLDDGDSVEADFTTWNDLLDIPQFPLQDNDIESSAHDTQCIGISIADLTLPEKEVTCTVKYQIPPSTSTFAFPTATLKAAFKRAVECPTGECSCKATNGLDTVYYPHIFGNSEKLFNDERELCEFPIICKFGQPEKNPWCRSPTTGFFRLVYKYSTAPKRATFVGMMYHSQDNTECPTGSPGCFRACA